MTLPLSSIIPEALKGGSYILLLLDPDKREWKPANLSGLALGDIFIQQDDTLN